MSDHPFDEVVATAKEKIAAGCKVYQKYTCSGCGVRLTVEEPNTFYESGTCDKCTAITDIRKQGCNYLLVYSGSKPIFN